MYVCMYIERKCKWLGGRGKGKGEGKRIASRLNAEHWASSMAWLHDPELMSGVETRVSNQSLILNWLSHWGALKEKFCFVFLRLYVCTVNHILKNDKQIYSLIYFKYAEWKFGKKIMHTMMKIKGIEKYLFLSHYLMLALAFHTKWRILWQVRIISISEMQINHKVFSIFCNGCSLIFF